MNYWAVVKVVQLYKITGRIEAIKKRKVNKNKLTKEDCRFIKSKIDDNIWVATGICSVVGFWCSHKFNELLKKYNKMSNSLLLAWVY